MNETLRSYTRCFFETCATIANITDEDVIRYLQNGLFLKHTYHNFGCNRLTTAVELRDMMAWWPIRWTRRTTASTSATMTSQAMATAILAKASGTTRGTPKRVSQTKKSWPLSAIRVARSQGTTKQNTSKSCTNSARYTRNRDTCSSSASASASH
jgi:hypothetical protein